MMFRSLRKFTLIIGIPAALLTIGSLCVRGCDQIHNSWSVSDRADWTAQCTIAFAEFPPAVSEVYCECAQKDLNGWRPYSWLSDGKSPTEDERAYMLNVHTICVQKASKVSESVSPTL